MAKQIQVDYIPDEGVPIPVRRIDFSGVRKLEKDQSIAYPLKNRASLQSLASRLKSEGKDFTIRKVDENTVRIWRTK